jgi:ceramide glucosyltransferase
MLPTHSLIALIGVLLLGLAAAYDAFIFIAMLVWQLRRTRIRLATSRPPVTLLKPLCGAEPELYENLRSFCLQDYPTYQIVFGAHDAADPAVAIARQLAREFPALSIDVVIDNSLHGSNRKVSNLISMLRCARHDILIIADSDARVGRDYLSAVSSPLLDHAVGMVTCIYRRIPARDLWSRLGAMYINDWYMPSVLLAWLFGHRNYASGQTMGLRRDTLEAVGGLPAVVNLLADDFKLGELVRGLGLQIVLSHYIPETVQEEQMASTLISHEVRWMRTIRALAPAGYRFLFLSFTLPLQAAGFALTIADPGLAFRLLPLLWATLICRVGVSSVPRLAQRRIPLSDLCLLPLRDLLLCWAWSRALFTSRVSWRGTEFDVGVRGVIRRSV